MLSKPRIAAVASALIALCVATDATAHISIDNAETKGGSFKAVFNVPHGCEKSPTTAVRITIPEGVIGIKPVPKPGWKLETTSAPYAKTYDYFHGMKVSEGVNTVTWSGGNLPNEYLDEFKIGLFVTKDVAAGSTLYFPVEQTCEKGSLSWSQVPEPGQSAHDLERPAPALRVAAKEAADAAPGANGVSIATPWLRATPGGATVGAGYLKITNGGAAPDKLLAASFAIAGRTEIHEMKLEDGVMKMRALPDGIDIAAGQTLELAPSGAHLMLLDLKNPIVAGAPVKGELTFEKAGKIAVRFAVAAVGASAPPAGEHAHH